MHQVLRKKKLKRYSSLLSGAEEPWPGRKRAAASDNWDLIILDIMLPGKDGFQVCQSLRTKCFAGPCSCIATALWDGKHIER
ncbi:MAG: hypothetical protein DRP87_10360 [Spirochaetes bacterium]|nr:MAG: hypothetical protein DRP87_10360 [Spirochaetota bacterium]